MNQKEVSELRKRFRTDYSNISKVFCCYVNGAGEIISTAELSLGLLPQDEQEMYLALLKKTLSGSLGRNLLDIPFSGRQVIDSDEHRMLQRLRKSSLTDAAAREELCRRIIGSLDMDGENYLILMAADTYDVPYRGRDGSEMPDASQNVYQYFVCCVCPVKAASPHLQYDADEKEFHSGHGGQAVGAPALGFLFPAFDDRTANIYNALFYTHDLTQIHQEFIDAVFCVEPPMAPGEQRSVFGAALTGTLENDCRFSVVQSVHEQLRTRLDEHRESRDPEPPELSLEQVADCLIESGVTEEKARQFRQECQKRYGEHSLLNPANLIESRKFEVSTPGIRISVAPDSTGMVQTRIINGRKFILIPAEGGVEINGIPVSVDE